MAQFTTTDDGVPIAYDIRGEGRPVLLIHGFASSRQQNWGSTGWIDRLAGNGFRVVSFDCRGHGESGKPHDPAAYGEHMLRDVFAVLDAAGEAAADIIGYSMGGGITIRVLMTNPGRVHRAVVAGQGETYFRERQAWREMIAAAMEAEDPASISDPEARRFRIFAGQKGKDRLALAACMRAPRRVYTPEELKASQRPVLVVAGEHDGITRSPVPLAVAFADGRAQILPGKDHMNAVGDPGFKRAAMDFFREP